MKFDTALEKHIGSLGRYQLFIVILACYIGIPLCLITLDTVFLTVTPKFRCAGALAPETHGFWNTNQSTRTENFNETQENWDKRCSGYFFINDTENNNGTLLQEEGSIKEIPCKHYEYDTSVFKTTVVTEVGSKLPDQYASTWSPWQYFFQ